MELESQAATLEQSKRIEELGIKIDSYFSWVSSISEIKFNLVAAASIKLACSAYLPAPTAEEIAELLPFQIPTGEDLLVDFKIWKYPDIYSCGYYGFRITHKKSLAQALADLLIWLIQNNRINPKELNG